jgi:hypothetical protein
MYANYDLSHTSLHKRFRFLVQVHRWRFLIRQREVIIFVCYTERSLLKVEAVIITKKQLHALRYIWKS